MRESVRPDVQLLIGERTVRGDQRVGRRRLRGDAFEQLCDGLAACERRSTVERAVPPRSRRDDREVEHSDVGIGCRPGDDRRKRLREQRPVPDSTSAGSTWISARAASPCSMRHSSARNRAGDAMRDRMAPSLRLGRGREPDTTAAGGVGQERSVGGVLTLGEPRSRATDGVHELCERGRLLGRTRKRQGLRVGADRGCRAPHAPDRRERWRRAPRPRRTRGRGKHASMPRRRPLPGRGTRPHPALIAASSKGTTTLLDRLVGLDCARREGRAGEGGSGSPLTAGEAAASVSAPPFGVVRVLQRLGGGDDAGSSARSSPASNASERASAHAADTVSASSRSPSTCTNFA